MALALALVDGFGESRLQGYRDAIRESLVVSLLLAGLGFVPDSGVLFFMPWFFMPSTAFISGFFGMIVSLVAYAGYVGPRLLP